MTKLIQSALLVVGFIGVTATAVITYRRQRTTEANHRLERDKFQAQTSVEAERSRQERYAKGAEMLAHESGAIRIAGLNVITQLGGEVLPSDPWRQTCVNLICSYLRSAPRPPTTTVTRLAGGRRYTRTQPPTETYLVVTEEACRLLPTLLDQAPAPEPNKTDTAGSFPLELDLRGATLSNLDLMARHVGPADFTKSVFLDTAAFALTKFSGDVLFVEAKFGGDVDFNAATFSRDALFSGATFSQDVHFDETKFSGEAWFHLAEFSGSAHFSGAEFRKDARFDGAKFNGVANFAVPAAFVDPITSSLGLGPISTSRDFLLDDRRNLSEHLFFGGAAHFDGAEFRKNARFDGAKFTGVAVFAGVKFSRYSSFVKAKFSMDPSFHGAEFREDPSFDGADFGGYWFEPPRRSG